MKKLFIRVADFIRGKFDRWAIARVSDLTPKAIITELYRKIAERDLLISTRTVCVKKGKIRYYLFIVKNKNLETVFNLGRCPEYDPEELIREAVEN